ncbi:MAG TPA: toll/interleukin-1 receptor domain-containing protein [Dyella sp.]|uniref:toll/interleukin-1 receptor domain-containing protein n=1 Tax=Dyella sp. TaxID=1869338 RepID=UPI002D79444E|nr:toll/interleukin-1 receptor domain-containing protein [Dyella sp.]HET6555395.1 toll/interleukin-1 receptor domain-containing protein [Dyella sp.]
MAQDPGVPEFRYRAFISYSHQDKAWADWLHRALENYRVPRRLVGQTTAAGVIPRRLLPIFRDRDELASATDLGRKVNEALALSENLIVICSPHSARSQWVNEEILSYKRLGRSEQIFCVIVGGEPNASMLPGRAEEECFAHALRFQWRNGSLSGERTEPIAADARPGKDGRHHAKLKLIAGILDIGFDQLRQREQQRHQRRLAAVATIAVSIMLATSTLALVAMHARRVADRERNQAENLVGFMLGDLNEKLRQVQRLDIMEAVDDRAMAYFQSLPNDDVTDTSLEQRTSALERIGSIRVDQGKLDAAMQSYEAALQVARPLAERSPNHIGRQVAYSRILTYIGMTAWMRGNIDEAQKHFVRAQDVLSHTPQAQTNDALLQQWAAIDNDLGHVLESRGQLDLATSQYRSMLAHCQALTSLPNPKTAWREILGEAHNNLGKMALLRGDLATAIAEYRSDDAIETALSLRDPSDHEQRDNMVRVRAILGRTLALAGDVEVGATYMQQAIDGAMELDRFDPNATDIREKIALYSSQLARLRRLSGQLDEARRLNTRAVDILTELTRKDTSNADWQRDLAEAQLELAAQFQAEGHNAIAHEQAKRAFDTIGPLRANQPDDRALLLDSVHARLMMANTTTDAQRALQWRQEALKDIEATSAGADDPRLVALRVATLLSLDRQADTEPYVRKLWTTGYRDLGLLASLKKYNIEYPANPEFQLRMQAEARQ